MARPHNRYRQIEYDHVVYAQKLRGLPEGGRVCAICKTKEQKPYQFEVDHINDNPDDNRPENKQLLCGYDQKIKELEREKRERQGVNSEGGSIQNLRVSERLNEPAKASDPASSPVCSDAIIAEYERRATRASAEAKNETNEPLVWKWIEEEWNRTDPTNGLIYPDVVAEFVRRLRETTGSGSDAAVKRYIAHKTSAGSHWEIVDDDDGKKRIKPEDSDYGESKELKIQRLTGHMSTFAEQRNAAVKENEELKKRLAQLEQELKEQPKTTTVPEQKESA